VAAAVMAPPLRLPIQSPVDVERARRAVRVLTRNLGFDRDTAERVVLATVELATNLVRYAQHGELCLTTIPNAQGLGVQIESRDAGPGIPDLEQALRDGLSTSGGWGNGLPAVRRLMTTFTIKSDVTGTRIIACAWPTSRLP
jgi:serine/threonine-protein kinase RsbT